MRELKLGSEGDAVEVLCVLLNWRFDGEDVEIRPYFDLGLRLTVMRFQRVEGLHPDEEQPGVVGPKTWKLLLGEAADVAL